MKIFENKSLRWPFCSFNLILKHIQKNSKINACSLKDTLDKLIKILEHEKYVDKIYR